MQDDAERMIHVRLPRDLIRRIDHIAVDWDLDRAPTFERLLAMGLDVYDKGHEAPPLAVSGTRRA